MGKLTLFTLLCAMSLTVSACDFRFCNYFPDQDLAAADAPVEPDLGFWPNDADATKQVWLQYYAAHTIQQLRAGDADVAVELAHLNRLTDSDPAVADEWFGPTCNLGSEGSEVTLWAAATRSPNIGGIIAAVLNGGFGKPPDPAQGA